ncbi:hypothetical protein PISMIDRAFT_679070 [Pisolithus microcarpus 441]|uniref:Uncharacterized protein n=1 Tax=Pisolithus microcarpus 441 TaxID=765257 RepID=A0A0C9ZMM6_9AGAM|nr:hypothetical protein PISMIDRAFT_679070 [Pisolithus microcarpus 441]
MGHFEREFRLPTQYLTRTCPQHWPYGTIRTKRKKEDLAADRLSLNAHSSETLSPDIHMVHQFAKSGYLDRVYL